MKRSKENQVRGAHGPVALQGAVGARAQAQLLTRLWRWCDVAWLGWYALAHRIL